MRILIESEGRSIALRIPTGVLVNRFTAGLAARAINRRSGREEPVLTAAQARALAKELRTCKKRFSGWTFVEVETDRERVVVRI